MNSYIKLEDGRKIIFQEIPKMLPATAFLSSLHVQVCNKLALKSAHSLSQDEVKVYVNLLFRKSIVSKQITGAIELVNSGTIKIDYIKSSFIDNDMRTLFNESIKVVVNPIVYCNYIDSSQFKIFFFKTILNNFYRLFQKIKPNNTVIRSWVDVTEEMYSDIFYSSQLLVYPFTLNIKRQLRFLRHLKRNHKNWSLAGLPYSFWNSLKLLIVKNKDVLLVKSEVSAYLLHAKEITKRKIIELHTSDDFEAGSLVLHKYLLQNKIQSHNTAHGIGFSLPNVHYTTFKVVNERQKEFYLENGNDFIEYKFGAARIKSPKRQEQLNNFNPLIVLIHGNCAAVNLHFEAELEDKLVKTLNEVSIRIGVPYKVKLHPNASQNFEDKMKKDHRVDTFKDMDDISNNNPIFVTLFSTAYYDFSKFGPFLFVGDELFDPAVYFGKRINIGHLNDLEIILTKYCKSDFYLKELEEQNA